MYRDLEGTSHACFFKKRPRPRIHQLAHVISYSLQPSSTPVFFSFVANGKVTFPPISPCSSSISLNHPLVKAGIELGRSTYGSPTLSDQAKLSCPSLKLGPGDSTRSHTANEFIFVKEIDEAITLYINLLKKIL